MARPRRHLLAQLDTDGKILVATATESVGDARLRRAQALANDTPTQLNIAQTLLGAKLAGQTRNLRNYLFDDQTAERVETSRTQMATASSAPDAIEIEASAARDYFSSWRGKVELRWANNDRQRIPVHWQTFSSRRSRLPVANNSRATDPINAILNYLYALAEVECRRVLPRTRTRPRTRLLAPRHPNPGLARP